jgi:hypothetical protein
MFERKFNGGKEQRGSGSRWRLAFLLLLAGVILVGGLLFAARHMAGQPVSHRTGGDVPSSTRVREVTPAVILPPAYREIFKEQIAQRLHLTIAQVKARVSEPYTSLYQVMVAQGIARAQVLSTEINALQAASDQMVSKGIWTQQQADENMQYWKNRAQDAQQTKQMDGEFSSWFTNG